MAVTIAMSTHGCPVASTGSTQGSPMALIMATKHPWVPHSTKSDHPGVPNGTNHSDEHPWVPHSTNGKHPGVSNGTNHSNEHPWVPHGTNPAGEQPGVVPTASPVSSEGGDVLLEDGLEAPGVDGLGGVGVPKGSDDIGEGCGDGWASARRLRKGLYQLGGGGWRAAPTLGELLWAAGSGRLLL